jgi:enoyl-CoA hydratase
MWGGDMAQYETIIVERSGVVAELRLNRPEALNANNRQMAAEIVSALEELSDMRVLIVTGNERAFSAGADLKERAADPTLPTMLAAYDALAAVPYPCIAAIEGYCLGGGLELALCCDLRVAAETAQLGTPEVLRGILPGGGGTQRLPRLIGPARAKELMFTGRRISAVTAERWGLVNVVAPHGEALTAARLLADELLAGAPLAQREIKSLVDYGVHLPLTDGLTLERERGVFLHTTADAREGIQAFVERRPPKFEGR